MEANGITGRVIRVETRLDALETDIKELRSDDIKEIKTDLRELKDQFLSSQRGMSRPEKLMFSGIVVTAVGAVTAVIALLVQGGHP